MKTTYEAKNSALKHYRAGRFEEAEKTCHSMLETEPNDPDVWHILGVIADRKGSPDIAADLLGRAIAINPQVADFHNSLGLALAALGQGADAIRAYNRALELNPHDADTCNHLGVAIGNEGDLDLAIETFTQALRLEPDHAKACNNLGVALKAKGDVNAAVDRFRHATRLDPDYAEAHWNLSFVLLLKGEFEEGWEEYEWRIKKGAWDSNRRRFLERPDWDGSYFTGRRLLVYGEQGFGDSLQFVRYLPMVKALGGTVTLAIQGPLLELFRTVAGIDELVEILDDGPWAEEVDLEVPLLSLPGIFGTNLESIPSKTPYLFADPKKAEYWRARLRGPEFKIGLVWKGRPTDPNRACPLERFAPLSHIPGVRLYGLQKNDPAAEAKDLPQGVVAADLGEDLSDFSDTAAAIENLDLIVSVDTSVAHLAGAMGKVTFTLLPFSPDWRWLLEREDSPWYPTMRLFRQKHRGDWDKVIKRLEEEVRLLVDRRTARQTPVLLTVGNRPPEPDRAESYHDMAMVFMDQGRLAEVVECYRKALELEPHHPEAYLNMGNAYQAWKKPTEAMSCYQRAVEMKPDYAEAYNNMGNIFHDQGRLADAISCFQKAIAIRPDYAEAYNNMGLSYGLQADFHMAISCHREACRLRPNYSQFRSNLLFNMLYDPAMENRELSSMAVMWWKSCGLTDVRGPDHPNLVDPERRLRVGYVSPDFRRHPVCYFFLPLLRAHDRRAVEVFCYSEVHGPDEITDRTRKMAENWQQIVGLSDEVIVEQIRKDRIDILVDLAGHTANNRLLAFAGRPAPVQVTWLGYPHTTGMPAIEYRMTDEIADPQGEADRDFTEHLVRLPNGFLCYEPPQVTPRVSRLPALEKGSITFGSFNTLPKVNETVVSAWSKILRQTPGSSLLLKSRILADERSRKRYLKLFLANGIPHDRIRLVEGVPSTYDHLALYNEVDIGLDPFPYNGTTTTCEALWMGVPVVTMIGDRHSARVGASIMTRIGLTDLIAGTGEEYVATAVKLAASTNRLLKLRVGLRSRMTKSPLCDARSFARNVEDAYREMWVRWCGQETIRDQGQRLESGAHAQ